MTAKKKTSRASKTKRARFHQQLSREGLPVHIRHNGDVDNELVNVRKSAKEEVIWYSDGDEFTVNFPVTPFTEHSFRVPAGGSQSSGPVRPDAPIDYYQYFITSVALAKAADPGVNVKP